MINASGAAEIPDSLMAYAQRLAKLVDNPTQEHELVEHIAAQGWDAGCWVRLDEAEFVRAAPAAIDMFLQQIRSREAIRSTADDPFPEGMDQSAIECDDPCWIIISQQCDILAALRDEPFIELARVYDLRDRERAGNLWVNSNRTFPVDPTEKRWVVDLRHRALLPKDRLPLLGPPRQALPRDDVQRGFKPRRRFLRRVGQRYSRAVVPNQLVEGLAEPLFRLLKNYERLVDILFHEWLLRQPGTDGAKPALLGIAREATDLLDRAEIARLVQDSGIAISEDLANTLGFGPDPDPDLARKMSADEVAPEIFSRLLDQLDPSAREMVDEDASDSIGADSFSVVEAEDCWRLDFESLSHSKRSDEDSARPLQ